jgi:hypothetical protein
MAELMQHVAEIARDMFAAVAALAVDAAAVGAQLCAITAPLWCVGAGGDGR